MSLPPTSTHSTTNTRRLNTVTPIVPALSHPTYSPLPDQPSTTMCEYGLFKSPRCGCKWLEITQPCGFGMGFNTCRDALPRDGRCHRAPLAYIARSGRCPRHGLDGSYDRNDIRFVVRVSNGFRLGAGPNPSDPGIEFHCAVM